MYKVVVMDDEPWVIRTLVDSVRWSQYGFEVAGTATDSKEGLELIRSLRPDLVFIDIRMPEMNGLECMKQAKAWQLPTQFIVVSGFAEFSYAQKSMQLGAVGYCLKPIDEDEIEAFLKKVKEDLDARGNKDVPPLIETIMEEQSHETVREYLQAKGLAIGREYTLRAICGLGVEPALPFAPGSCVALYQGSRKSILLVREDQGVSLLELCRRAAGKMAFKGIGISSPVTGYDRLKAAVEEAELAAHQYFITGKPSLSQAAGANDVHFSEFRDIYPALQKRDMNELDGLYDLYLERLISGKYHLKHALLLYYTVMTAIIHSDNGDHSEEPPFIFDYELLIERYQNAEEMIKDLKRMTVAYLGDMFSGRPSAIRSESFKAILQYVHDHYQEEITLQKLSECFFMNPNYVSQLFIKHLGKQFTGYLAELRVRNACQKLKAGNQPIQEIAAAVGIHDPYYFSKIFRKVTGMSPREYRRKSG